MGRKKNIKDLDAVELEFINEKMKASENSISKYMPNNIISTLDYKINIKCKNDKQKTFLKNLQNLNVKLNICDAPAGVGKSLLALTAGLYHLKNGNVEKVIVFVPTVEASEATKIGLLPGTIEEKTYPFQMATRSTLEKILKLSGNVEYKEYAQRLIRDKFVDFELLSYARGRTFDNSFIIIDEAENLSKRETILLISRIGEGNSKVVLIGDKDQCDRKGLRDINECGLVHAKEKLLGVEGVSVDEFTTNDIVRNTFITRILDKW